MDVLPAYDDRYIKITANGDKFNTNFGGSNVSDNGVECEFLQSFLLIIYEFMVTNIACKYI